MYPLILVLFHKHLTLCNLDTVSKRTYICKQIFLPSCCATYRLILIYIVCQKIKGESGHWAHLTSDLPTASGGVAFLLRKGRPSCRSHMALSNSHSKGCFSHHGPNTSFCCFLAKIQRSGRSHEWGPAQCSWQT